MRIQSEELVNDSARGMASGRTFPNDEERRKHFLGLLREKLKDPEFRKIEGSWGLSKRTYAWGRRSRSYGFWSMCAASVLQVHRKVSRITRLRPE